jgi:hypothetical protein
MIFLNFSKNFRRKNWRFWLKTKLNYAKLAFFTQNKAKLCKILIITLVFEKNANFFTKNCRKSQKIVSITWPQIGRSLTLGIF